MRYLWIEHSSGDLPAWVPGALDRCDGLGFSPIYTVPPDRSYNAIYDTLSEGVIAGYKINNAMGHSGAAYDLAGWQRIADVVADYRRRQLGWFARWLPFLSSTPKPVVLLEGETLWETFLEAHRGSQVGPDYAELDRCFALLPSNVQYWFYPIAKTNAESFLRLRGIAQTFQDRFPDTRFITAEDHMPRPCSMFDSAARYTEQFLVSRVPHRPLHMRYVDEVWPGKGWRRTVVSAHCDHNTILYAGSGEADTMAMLQQLESEAPL